MKFKPESKIFIEAKMTANGKYRCYEALFEAKKFVQEENLIQVHLNIGNFKTVIKPDSNLETIGLQYADFARNNKVKPEKKQVFVFELL
jgi:hypothetical protein